jgi:hypothetical protein
VHDIWLLIAFLLFCVSGFISFTQNAWVWVLGFAGLALLTLGLAVPIDVSIG